MKALTQSRRLIDTQVQLKEFLPELRKSSWVSLDTEADSLHSYPEKLCLLQISLPDTDVLIDPLQKLDMTALFKALAMALRAAVEQDPRASGEVPSTKGAVSG
mgnify:CR=1 FL=1